MYMYVYVLEYSSHDVHMTYCYMLKMEQLLTHQLLPLSLCLLWLYCCQYTAPYKHQYSHTPHTHAAHQHHALSP